MATAKAPVKSPPVKSLKVEDIQVKDVPVKRLKDEDVDFKPENEGTTKRISKEDAEVILARYDGINGGNVPDELKQARETLRDYRTK